MYARFNGSPRRNGRALLAPSVLAAGLAILAASCSKNPSLPRQALLSGTVLDNTGQPVVGARVELSYPYAPPAEPRLLAPGASGATRAGARIADVGDSTGPGVTPRTFMVSDNPCSLGTVQVHFSLPKDAQAGAAVKTRGGVVIRTLFIRSFAAGTYTVEWDGRDDSTAPVPADVYHLTLIETQGDSTFSFGADVLWNPSDPNAQHNLVTDSDGRFLVAVADLPVGLTIHAVSAAGDSLGDFRVGGLIRISATGPLTGPLTTGTTVITYSGGSPAVTVRLP